MDDRQQTQSDAKSSRCLWQGEQASMECPLWRLLISSRSVSKHGYHMKFLFLIGRFLENLLLWNCLVVSEKNFKNRPIRNKNCLWWPCLVMDHNKMWHSIERTFHRCFLPSFSSFGWGFSEHMKFLFLIGRFLENLLLWNCLAIWTET
jgi:hypothetical protein